MAWVAGERTGERKFGDSVWSGPERCRDRAPSILHHGLSQGGAGGVARLLLDVTRVYHSSPEGVTSSVAGGLLSPPESTGHYGTTAISREEEGSFKGIDLEAGVGHLRLPRRSWRSAASDQADSWVHGSARHWVCVRTVVGTADNP